MTQITLAKIKPEIDQAWLSKQDAIIYFGYENHKRVFQQLMKEFKEHEDYREGYILPTFGIPLINLEKFEQFLRWRATDKHKR